MLKKIIFIMFVFIITGCSSSKTIGDDFKSIEEYYSQKHSVKRINQYSTDALPNIDGYIFKIDNIEFKILKMENKDFDNLSSDENIVTNNEDIRIIKNSFKPYVMFTSEKDNQEKATNILSSFKNININ